MTVLLVALALAFSASLLPAAGIGTHPGAHGSGTGDNAGPSQSTAPNGSTGTDRAGVGSNGSEPGTADTTPSPTPTSDSEVGSTDSDSQPTSTAATTATAIPTETADGAGQDDRDDDDLAGLFQALLLLLVVTGVGIVGAVRYGDADRTRHQRAEYGVAGAAALGVLDHMNLAVNGVSASLSRGTMSYIVGVSRGAPGLLDTVSGIVGEVATGLSFAAAGTTRGLGSVLGATAGGIVAGIGGLAGAFGSFSLPGTGIGSLTSGGEDRPTTTDARATGPDPEAAEPADVGPVGFYEAWDAFEDAVPVRFPQSRTPVEFAAAAIDAGFPAHPVVSLTAVFQEVAYGGHPVTDDRLTTAREALAALAPYLEDDDDR